MRGRTSVQIIEAAKGYQAEMSLPGGWTAYSDIYRTRDGAEAKARKFAAEIGVNISDITHDTKEPPDDPETK